MLVIGIPSMRLIRLICVFTPEPWQGYGDQTNEVLAGGNRQGRPVLWADTHHPSLSETNGEFDGEFLFINDKASARVAVIDVKDFVTQQIVTSQLIESDRGATFVATNTEYVVEPSQFPAPLAGEFAPVEEYDEKYRGAVIFWKFDREAGRIIEDESWAIELPPYT